MNFSHCFRWFRPGDRILVGRLEISGYYSQLSAGLSELGVEHDYITYWRNPYGFGGETHSPLLLRLSERFPAISTTKDVRLPKRVLHALIREVLITTWALGALVRYDAFIFGFGETLLRKNVDLIILRILRKPVIVNMAHGSEARPPYLDGSAIQMGESHEQQAKRLAGLTKKVFRRVRRIERWATFVIGAPYSNSQFSSRSFINHFAIGIPYSASNDGAEEIPNPLDTRSTSPSEVVVLHSPSNPAVKGTSIIEGALEGLRQAGYRVTLHIIAGRPNSEVLEALKGCDLVVDQVFSDTPLAGFATEAAWMGRCTVVAGYGLSELEQHIPPGMLPPSIVCLPDDLQSTLKALFDDPDCFRRVGTRARGFMCDTWASKLVAERYLRILCGDVPKQWWTNPLEVAYVNGMGMPLAQVNEIVSNLIAQEGVNSLMLNDRPDLLHLLLAQVES